MNAAPMARWHCMLVHDRTTTSPDVAMPGTEVQFGPASSLIFWPQYGQLKVGYWIK